MHCRSIILIKGDTMIKYYGSIFLIFFLCFTTIAMEKDPEITQNITWWKQLKQRANKKSGKRILAQKVINILRDHKTYRWQFLRQEDNDRLSFQIKQRKIVRINMQDVSLSELIVVLKASLSKKYYNRFPSKVRIDDYETIVRRYSYQQKKWSSEYIDCTPTPAWIRLSDKEEELPEEYDPQTEISFLQEMEQPIKQGILSVASTINKKTEEWLTLDPTFNYRLKTNDWSSHWHNNYETQTTHLQKKARLPYHAEKALLEPYCKEQNGWQNVKRKKQRGQQK